MSRILSTGCNFFIFCTFNSKGDRGRTQDSKNYCYGNLRPRFGDEPHGYKFHFTAADENLKELSSGIGPGQLVINRKQSANNLKDYYYGRVIEIFAV